MQHQAGVETGCQDVGEQPLHWSQREQHAPRRVEQRHRVNPHITRAGLQDVRAEPGVVRNSPMAQDRALREAGGPGGVLDLRVIIRPDLGQALRGRPGADEAVPPCQRDHLAQAGKAAADLRQRLRQVSAAVGRRQHHPLRTRLGEHVLRLACAQRRIDRDQRQAGQRGPELQKQPLRTVRSPHRDPLTGREPAQQRPGHSLRGRQQLVIGPAAAQARVGKSLNDSQRARGALSRLTHDPADCGLKYRPGGAGGLIGSRGSVLAHAYIIAPSHPARQ